MLAAALTPAAAQARLLPFANSSVGSLSVRITYHPKSIVRTHAAKFDWATVGILGRTRCKIDGGAYNYCPGKPALFGHISDGMHTFTIRVSNGYKINAYASYSWDVDTVSPAPPNSFSGGSLGWQKAKTVGIQASGGSDTGSGVGYYQHRIKVNGGAWTAPAAGATAVASVRGSDDRPVPDRGQGRQRLRLGAHARRRGGHGAARPRRSHLPRGHRRVALVAERAAGADRRFGLDRRTLGRRHLPVPRVDQRRHELERAAGRLSSTTSSPRARRSSSSGRWTSPGTHRPGRRRSPARPTRCGSTPTGPTVPTVTGGSLSWQKVTSLTITGSHSVDTGSGLNHYEHRISTDGGITWSSAVLGPTQVVTAEGQTLVQVRAVDNAGNASAWTPQTVIPGATSRIDRTNPTDPTVGITPPGWHNVAAITVFAGAATDALSGVDHYQFRSSPDGGLTWTTPVNGATGVVTAEGSTLVQFRAVDAAGNMSNWAPAAGSAANTVRIDRTPPNAPLVTGGSLAWQTVAAVTLTASGSQDSPAGIDHYEYRTSTDGGDNWGDPQTGALATITGEGETLVQFRAVDGAGNASAWAPAGGTPSGTVRIDRSVPADPTVTGGSLQWQGVASVPISATGGTDPLSGLDHYQYRESTDGGITWGTPLTGSVDNVTASGETLVQFRSVDAAGNVSNWAPASAGANDTVRIDHGVPTPPTVSGGSLTWVSAGSAQANASGSTDAQSGVDHYQYRTSADGGVIWTAAANGSTAVVSAEGESVVQFRAVDAAGNVSLWAPATPTPAAPSASTARLPPRPARPAARSYGRTSRR